MEESPEVPSDKKWRDLLKHETIAFIAAFYILTWGWSLIVDIFDSFWYLVKYPSLQKPMEGFEVFVWPVLAAFFLLDIQSWFGWLEKKEYMNSRFGKYCLLIVSMWLALFIWSFITGKEPSPTTLDDRWTIAEWSLLPE